MILIVDDKPENLFSLKRLLETNGFEIDTADSGENALKKILNNTYSLIILDVQMPVMDGFEVAEAISGYSKAKDIPIIFLSAVNTDKKFITKGYTSGGIDYITKPVDPDIFILKVRTLHRLYEQNRELHQIQLSLRQEVETRKQAENELNKRVQELRSVLESLPQMAFTAAPNGEIEYVNEHWYIYSDKIKKLPEVYTGDNTFVEKWQMAIKTGEPLVCEVCIRNIINNTFRYHLLKMIPVKQHGAILKWVGTFTDIHEQKSANEILESKVLERTHELVDKNKELEASNHELQQFASVASHDLKEPLRKIQIFSSILKERFLGDNEQAQDSMKRIVDASERMSGLISDLLDYSRLSVNSLFKPTDIGQLVKEIVNDLEFTIHEKHAQIIIGELPVIDAIPGQMRQVFQNLINNSLKFTAKASHPVIKINSEIIVLHGNDYCRITVADNGIGFNEKYVDKIFTIFQRLNPKESFEGTGIGLAIVKKIVDKHSGTITAHSKEGEGATFIMTLPVQQVLQAETILTDTH